MSGAYSDDNHLKHRRTFVALKIFEFGTFHATTLCLSSPSRQILLCLFCAGTL